MTRALLVLYPGCIYHEVSAAVARLSGRGVALDVVTPDGAPCSTGEGLTIGGAAYSSVDPEQYDVALLPGGDVEAPLGDTELHALLRSLMDSDGTLVAAICNGAVVLGAAGVLDGRRATHTVHSTYAGPEFTDVLGPFVAGATYVDEDVVTDGDLITAKPWATDAFASAVVEQLGDS